MPDNIEPQRLDLPTGNVYIVLTPTDEGQMLQVYNLVDTKDFSTVVLARGIIEYVTHNLNEAMAAGYLAVHRDSDQIDAAEAAGTPVDADEYLTFNEDTPTSGSA